MGFMSEISEDVGRKEVCLSILRKVHELEKKYMKFYGENCMESEVYNSIFCDIESIIEDEFK